MRRRAFVTLAASTFATPIIAGPALAGANDPGGDLDAALGQFLRLPGTTSCLLHAGQNGSAGRIAHRPDLLQFIASAYKTFILGQYLRDVEAGRLTEDEALPIDDTVRDLGSPVFMDLAGKTPARSVLEAMMSHSDNTATNAATLRVGPDRVRALLAQAGLTSIRIPDSTRIFLSYILGAPLGVDLGWPAVLQALANPPHQFRPLFNNQMTLAGTARDLVSWYELALQGSLFAGEETRTEFKRIQGMSVQIVQAVPPDTLAYVKGGEVESFEGFNAKSFAGQILAGRTPVTFCFLVNWNGPADAFAAVEAAFFASIRGILAAVKQGL